jgi:hypothetical protein
MLDNCDFIGIYEYNEELLRVQIGFGNKVDVRSHIKELEEKVEWFNDGVKLWIVNFIKVQYGVLKDKSSVHKGVLRELENYRESEKSGLKFSNYLKAVNQLLINGSIEKHKGLGNPYIRTKAKDMYLEDMYLKENLNTKESAEFLKIDGKKNFSIPAKEQVHEVMARRSDASIDANFEAQQFINFYESKGWKVGGQEMVNWQASAQKWIDEKMQEQKIKKIKNTNGVQQPSNLKSSDELLKKFK